LRQLCRLDSHCISRFTAIQQRILDRPQLFLKAQRQRASEPLSTAIADLSLDLGMVVAISHRANRRLACATVELDRKQCGHLRQIIGKIDAIAHKHNTSYFLAGATAREIILLHVIGLRPGAERSMLIPPSRCVIGGLPISDNCTYRRCQIMDGLCGSGFVVEFPTLEAIHDRGRTPA
jgi:hypothetical protein